VTDRLVPWPTESLDIAPTILAHLGIVAPRSFAGRNLLPSVVEELDPPAKRLFAEHADKRACMVRDGRYKYIEYFKEPFLAEPKRALYDLVADPSEQKNLVSQQPELAQELSQAIARYYQDTAAPGESPRQLDDPTIREHLRSLGYLE
jgi:arylsulfatase A-like enzyme